MRKLMMALLAASALATPACASRTDQETANTAAASAPKAGNQVAAANLPDADPAMWVVRDEDTTVYLFGTFHLLDGKSEWFNDEVRQAFDQSQELVFEIAMPDDQVAMAKEMQPLIMRYALDQQGRTISSRLTAEENKKLNDALAKVGAPAGAFDKFEPWFVTMSLSAVAAQKAGLSGGKGAEQVLKQAAVGRNMQLGAVETLEGQIQMFDGMPEEQQIQQLKDTLAQMNESDNLLPRMLAVWKAGDEAGLEAVMNEGLNEHPELRRVLLENRNKAWAEWIDQRLDKPGTVFMAVGAGHLVGPDSVQSFLKQRNIASQRVAALTPNR